VRPARYEFSPHDRAGSFKPHLAQDMGFTRLEVRIELWLYTGKVDLLRVQEAHWQIIDALEKGEGNQAGTLLREHIFLFPHD
jgi:hypothetical protein